VGYVIWNRLWTKAAITCRPIKDNQESARDPMRGPDGINRGIGSNAPMTVPAHRASDARTPVTGFMWASAGIIGSWLTIYSPVG
jgi:hypothetical protein